MERVRRIELPYAAWEAAVLPLNYTRAISAFYNFTSDGSQESPSPGRGMVVGGDVIRG